MPEQNKMAVMPVPKLVLNMSVPLMTSLLIQSLYNIVDSIFVARISERALTATSLAYPMQFLMIAVSVGGSVGLNTLLSRQIGRGKEDEACQSATTGLLFNLGVALLFSLIGLFGSRAIADSFTNDKEIADLCFRYMRICVVFCPGIFLEKQGQRMLQAVGNSSLSMISQIAGAVTNLILDPIMIFGLFGFPAMGITGAAVATVIGQWAGGLLSLILNRIYNPSVHIRFRGWKFSWRDVKAIYKVGAPSMVMQGAGSLMFSAVNALLITISPTAVAFFGVYYRLQSFLMMPVNGLGQAAIPIVGFNYGAGNKERILMTRKVVLSSSVVLALAGTLIFELFPAQLLGFFSAGEEMMRIGVPALRIIAVSFVFAAVTTVCGFFSSGLGNGVIGMVGAFLRQVVVLVPCLRLFMHLLGFDHCWYAVWVAEIIAFLFTVYFTNREIKKKTAEL